MGCSAGWWLDRRVLHTPSRLHQATGQQVELRIKQYEEFAKDLSTFIFEAEIQHEFLSADWATSEGRVETVKSYNAAITVLRSKELVYLAWAERYWGSAQLPAFESIVQRVKEVDEAVHAFNDNKITREKLTALHERTSKLRAETRALLAPRKTRRALAGA